MKKTSLALLLATAFSVQACFPLVAAGTVTTVMAVADRRSVGAQADDESIEWKAEARVAKQFPHAHINVISFNRRAVVTGEAATDEAAKEIGRLVAGVENVLSVVNEIRIGSPSTLQSRANDAYLTSKVKARFIDANKFPANRVKVFTEAATVFLLGVVTQTEADAAIEVARTTGGVLKVINVMEVISDAEAKRIDAALGASAASGKPTK